MKKDDFIQTAYSLIDTVARENVMAAQLDLKVLTDTPGLSQTTTLQYAFIEDDLEDDNGYM